MEQAGYTLEYTLDVNLMSRAAWRFFWRKKSVSVYINIGLVLLFGLQLLTVGWNGLTGLLVIILLVSIILTPIQFTREVSKRSRALGPTPVTLAVDPGGVREHTPLGHSDTRWAAYSQLLTFKDCDLLITIANTGFHAIPASVMTPEARALIRECLAARPKEGRCPRCKYDLTGNESGRCPECGTVIGPQAIQTPRTSATASQPPAPPPPPPPIS